MATKRKKYRISHSNFTVKKVHKKLDNNVTIYERDYSTLYGVGTWKPGEIGNSANSFKMVQRNNSFGVKKYNTGGWITVEGSGNECWTKEDIQNALPNTSENKVELKPIYKSLTNFAYFGSCVDLIKTSVENIILKLNGVPHIDEKIKKEAKLTEFESFMLNTNTVPLFTMAIDYPHETENGIETYTKKFTFPSTEDGGIKIDGIKFEEYFSGLLDLASFYDSRQTNNLWRSMTHDSIKNMDSTFMKPNEDSDDYVIGATKMESIIMALGRQLDLIKLYADNVKQVRNVSYSEEGVMPDYFLSDKLEMSGWEVCSVAPSTDNSIKSSIKFTSESNTLSYTSSDANVKFMQNLAINSKEIFSRKGTKHGIDMLLSLFGLKSYEFDRENYDYKIDEFVHIATAFNDGLEENVQPKSITESFNVEKYNTWKKTYDTKGAYDNKYAHLQGLPITFVETNDDRHYIIPWYSSASEMDGNIHFESSGGWMSMPHKTVKNVITQANVTLSADTIKLYRESIKPVLVIAKLSDMAYINVEQLHDNAICYVSNISDFEDWYKQNSDGPFIGLGEVDDDMKSASHYFILKNTENRFTIGHLSNGDGGWVNVPLEDFNDGNLTDDAMMVLYAESIEDNHKGNNPHSGNKYDDGDTYKSVYERIFDHSIKTDNFRDIAKNCEDDSLKEEISATGFSLLTNVKDNSKVHFFTDINSVGHNNGSYFYDSDVVPHDFETNGTGWTESSANSIINTKHMTITFYVDNNDASEMYKYLNNCVFPYLEQMIPSTAIVKIELNGTSQDYTHELIVENFNDTWCSINYLRAIETGNTVPYKILSDGNESYDYDKMAMEFKIVDIDISSQEGVVEEYVYVEMPITSDIKVHRYWSDVEDYYIDEGYKATLNRIRV